MCQVNSEDGLMHDFLDVERMERLITKSLDASRGTSIPAIKRCLPRTPYLRSSDDRCRVQAYTAFLPCQATMSFTYSESI